LYAYVSGHVLKSVDPLGLCAEGTSCEADSSNEDGSVGNSDGTSDNSSNAPEMAEADGGESEAPDCWAAGCNPVTGDYSDRDKWESEQQAKQDGQIAVATVGASVIPGAGEAMDLAV